MKAKTDQEACNLLDNLVIASPCSIAWDAMTGDNRKRLCGGCSRYVHNISDMTRDEAETFLQENGTSRCMIFYRRFDGTIMTDDCPVGLRKIRDACRVTCRVAASFLVMLLSIPGAIAQQLQSNQAQQNCRIQQTNPGKVPWHMNRFGAMVGPDWKEPTPPSGFYYDGNPAGGGMILRPITDNRSVQPINSIAPAFPRQPIAIPTAIPSPQGHAKLDSTANTFYERGQAATIAGQKSLAKIYYEKAIEAFDNQKAGDAKFRKELERSLKSIKDALK